MKGTTVAQNAPENIWRSSCEILQRFFNWIYRMELPGGRNMGKKRKRGMGGTGRGEKDKDDMKLCLHSNFFKTSAPMFST